MSGFLLRIVVNAVVLFMVLVKIPGIFVDTLGGALLGAAIVGLANALINPILSLTELAPNRTVLGGLTAVINLGAVGMVFKTLPGYQVTSLLALATGMILVTCCSCTMSRVVRDSRRSSTNIKSTSA